jgi:DEAD/DEAH box helicase domain-containing protein
LLADYGADPQFVCTSATIGNPAEHAERLTGEPFTVVDEDGSPTGRRELAFWKPPVDESSLAPDADFDAFRAAQSSPIREGSDVLAHLGSDGYQTLLFTRSRKGAELGAKYARSAAARHPEGDLSVEPYHAGLGKETRRGTEYQVKTGTLDGVTATTALELGIDIGSMDATVLTGYPGTRQSFWQQVGRSGRGTRASLSVYVAGGDAIDQYILDHPEHVLGEPIEDAVIGLENNPVYAQHVLAAAHEKPLEAADREYFDGERLDRAVDMWRDAGRLEGDLSRAVRYTGSPRPQADISMYTTGGRDFEVRCENCEIDMEPISRERAYRDHHEGALFLHAGQQYEVVAFEEDVPNPSITVRQVDIDAYTETHSSKTIRDIEAEERRDLGGGFHLAWGTGTVEVHYREYTRKEIGSNRVTAGPLPTGLPPIELHTQLVWIELPPDTGPRVLEAITGEAAGSLSEREHVEIFGGGLHGAEHGMIKLTPLELRMDTSDLGGLSTPRHAETGVPTWFIHDAVDGGLGFSKRIYESFGSVAARTRDRVESCDCAGTNGCPACIMDSQCGNQNRPLHTEATVEILDRVLDHV